MESKDNISWPDLRLLDHQMKSESHFPNTGRGAVRSICVRVRIFHRIIGTSRLEKTFKIIKLIINPTSPYPLNHVLNATFTCFFNTCRWLLPEQPLSFLCKSPELWCLKTRDTFHELGLWTEQDDLSSFILENFRTKINISDVPC